MFIPNIFILGAAKSGTTSLHNFLNKYADVCMANPKEPFFFESEYEKGLDYYKKKYFAHYNNEKYIGDSRHRNLFLPFVPQRIYDVNKNAKFIIILRNPIDRTFSHWWHFYSRGIEKKSFYKKIQEEIKLYDEGVIDDFFSKPDVYKDNLMPYGEANHTSYVLSSLYVEQIERYFKLFKKEQFFIIDFDEFRINDKSVLAEMLTWLFGEEREVLEFEKDNTAKQNDLRGGYLFLNKMFTPIKAILPTSFIYKIKKQMLNKPKITKKEKEILLEFFKPYNERLKEIINFDTDKWGKI